jgi:hypothetical protein
MHFGGFMAGSRSIMFAGALVGPVCFGIAAAAQTAGQALQVQETNVPGIVAEMTECKRKEGVLTVKVRFRNTSDKTSWFAIDTGHGKYEGFYVSAGNKKYFVLKDAEGAPVAPKYIDGGNLEKGQTYTWWAKFPAPPAEVKQVNLMMPKVLPFEDVPVADR